MVKIIEIKKTAMAFFCSFLILMTGFTSTITVMAGTNGNSPAIVCIDTPTSNSALSNNTLNVSGWSLEKSGVKQVQVSVDNAVSQNATIGISRLDVDAVHPGYTGGKNSGYSYNLDMTSLSIGKHTITIKSTGNDGVVTANNVNISKVPTIGKSMPQMVDIDTPSNNSYISSGNTLSVVGWSLNGYGVKKVQVYIDNGSEADATLGLSRQDVANAFQGYVGANTSGYSASLTLPALSDGVHTIKVVSTGNDGSVATGTININKVSEQSMPGIVTVDTPQSNSTTSSNTLNVVGWSLNVTGVKEVQVSVDNGAAQDATIGIQRLDVNGVYPGYTGGKTSGYSTSLDITSLSMGTHTITVMSTGNDGVVTTNNVNISKVPTIGQAMPPMVDIDTPSNNSDISSNNTLNVVGWSLNGYGVKKVQVYIDNGNETDATIGLSRQDVDNMFPGYVGGNTSGYSASLKLPALSAGIHTIEVVSTGNDGSVTTSTVNINKLSEQNTPGIVTIDTPKYSQVTATQIGVTGWSLDLNGVKSVQVSVDNGNMQQATIGLLRQDVANIYPQYADASISGFTTELDISNLSTGIHTITVVSTGEDGTTATNTTQIDILPAASSNLSSMLDIDTPSDDAFIKAENYLFNVTGWSLDAFGVKEVQVYVDNIYTGDATIGIPRTDVDNTYPGYTGGVNSGYNYLINISSLSYGAHDISVRSIGNDGVVTTKDIVIYKVYNDTNLASTIVSFLDLQSNLDLAEGQALNLHDGDYSDNCVYFSSSVLRDIGINVPAGMANTQNYVPFVTSLGFTEDYNVNDLYPGNICFTVSDGTGYPTHTYIFMGWVNPFDHTLAYVADNQSNVIHIRSMIDAPNTDAFNFGFHN